MAAAKTKKANRGRTLGDGELRALVATCAAAGNAEGRRDAVLFSLVLRGLKIAEITNLTVESVRFTWRSPVSRSRRVENIEPYALGGDRRGDYRTIKLWPGTHAIEATPFDRDRARGQAGQSLSIRLDVVSTRRKTKRRRGGRYRRVR